MALEAEVRLGDQIFLEQLVGTSLQNDATVLHHVSAIRDLQAGDQTVNDEPQMPFGGVKGSGYGRFGGLAALDEFTELVGCKFFSCSCGSGVATQSCDSQSIAICVATSTALVLEIPLIIRVPRKPGLVTTEITCIVS